MITFEEAEHAALDDIMKIEEACFNRATRESREVYRERIAAFPHGCIMMRDDGACIGFAAGEIWRHADVIIEQAFTLGHSIERYHCPDGDELYISSIAVRPESRGAGLGERLFDALIDNVRRNYPAVKRGILLLNEDWTAARNLYTRKGFFEAAVFPRFFTADDGSARRGIVMRAEFS